MSRGGARVGAGRKRKTEGLTPNSNGYILTTVGPVGPGSKRVYAHRAIAFGGEVGGTFIPPRGEVRGDAIVPDHLDGVRTNNDPSNLELVTMAENNRRSARKRYGHA